MEADSSDGGEEDLLGEDAGSPHHPSIEEALMRWPADLILWLTVISMSLAIVERVFRLAKEAIQMKQASKEIGRPSMSDEGPKRPPSPNNVE